MDIYDAVLSQSNLRKAWTRIKSKSHCPGIDGVKPADFKVNLDANLNAIREAVTSGTYTPATVKSFQYLVEPPDKFRTLGILTVTDRIVCQAVAQVLKKIFEPDFFDCSYAYQSGKSALDAISLVESTLKSGCRWILESDIKSFFDSIDHDLLCQMLTTRIQNAKLIELIKSLLAISSYDEKSFCFFETGVVQGSPLSPLLSNIYLTPFDKIITQAGFKLIRYADDFVILDENQEKIQLALELSEEVLHRLKLTLSEPKTRIVEAAEGFNFLGYTFTSDGIFPGKKSIENLKIRLLKSLEDTALMSIEDQVSKLVEIIRGWRQYFRDIPHALDDMPFAVQAARILDSLDTGNQDAFHRLTVLSRRFMATDAHIHYWLGVVLQSKGYPDLARNEYVTALLCDNASEAHPNLCLEALHIKEKKWEKRASAIQALWKNDLDSTGRKNLAEIFAECGGYGTAKWLADLDDTTPQTSLPQHQVPITVEPIMDRLNPPPGFQTIELSEKAVETFMDLFQGKEGVTGRAKNFDDGRKGYSMISEPFTKDLLTRHLAGEDTYGMFLERSNGRIMLCVVDIDIKKQKILEREEDNKDIEDLLLLTHQDAVRCIQVADHLGIPTLLEDSGYKGRHIWIFFESPVEKQLARHILKLIIDQVGAPPEGIRRELFPKSDKYKPEKLGDLIKLPLGLNPNSLRRALFVNSDGSYPDPERILLNTKKLRNARLSKLMERISSDKKVPIPVREAIRVPLADLKDIPLKGPIKQVAKGCAVLRYLIHKAQTTHYLNHLERLAVLYILGHLGQEGKAFVHRVIAYCMNYDPTLTQSQIDKMKPSPISCPRLREHFPKITASIGCNCKFDHMHGNTYPSPVLHAKLTVDHPPRRHRPVEISPIPDDAMEPEKELDTLVKKFIELRKQFRGISKSLKRQEEILNKFFDEDKTDQLETALGILVRQKEGDSGEYLWRIEI